MPGIYTRHHAIFSSSPSSGQYRVMGSSTASIRSSSGSRYSVRRSSGRSSITSSQRSNDWQDSVRSNLSMPRNSRTYNLSLSTPRMSFFAESATNTTTAPMPFSSSRDNSNDWGYFVDCDDNLEELPMVLDHYRGGTDVIPEGPQDGFILEL